MPLNGVPLVAWSIIQSKAAHSIRNVYVSTDDDEIENISLRYGADTIRRPDWPDADRYSANVPFKHALRFLEENLKAPPEAYLTLLPTSVLRKPEDIDSFATAYTELRKRGDLLLTCLATLNEFSVFLKRNNTPFSEATPAHHNKHGDYAAPCLGMAMHSADSYFNFCEIVHHGLGEGGFDFDYDDEIDQACREGVDAQYAKLTHYIWYAQEWQLPDIDRIDDFRVCEALQREFIIGNNTVSGEPPWKVYSEYAGHSVVPEQKELPL